MACSESEKSESSQNQDDNSLPVKLMTVDPGHFHAALVQKFTYESVDSTVHVFAPEGPDLDLHLGRIENFNTRDDEPTNWNEVIYRGNDFFEEMIKTKPGNVVVLSGNNRKKIDYITESLENNINVLADKPMVINSGDFEKLKKAFDIAKENNLLLYDIMTERHEITTKLQKELSQIPAIFGTLENGSLENPAITKESVHHFFKYVSGSILTRPPWFMDVEQQGEGIVDVTTHLIDLVQWEAFPEQIIDYTQDIELLEAKRWPTRMTPQEFGAITRLEEYPEYLQKDVVDDSVLAVYCNGEVNYKLKDIYAKVSVTWAYRAPEGGGDTHYSIMRGTLADLVIEQGEAQGYVPTLYIKPNQSDESYLQAMQEAFDSFVSEYPGVMIEKSEERFKVVIPSEYRVGHEAHFSQVTENYLEYLRNGNMPSWEVPNMIAKYYTTLMALEMAKSESE